MPPVAAEIFGKMGAMEHHASPPSSLIWLGYLFRLESHSSRF